MKETSLSVDFLSVMTTMMQQMLELCAGVIEYRLSPSQRNHKWTFLRKCILLEVKKSQSGNTLPSLIIAY